MNNPEGPNFLKEKYDLHKAEEVEFTVRRTQKRTGEKISQEPAKRIQNYLNRFKEILERKDPAKRERGIQALKKVLLDKFIIKPSEIPQSYYDLQGRIIEERGQLQDLLNQGAEIETYTAKEKNENGDIIEITKKHYYLPKEMKSQLEEAIISEQKTSLDNWIDYLSLSGPEVPYPTWAKYWAIRSILQMGGYNKEKKQFEKRSTGTTKPFSYLNREALGFVLDAIEKKRTNKEINTSSFSQQEINDFQQALKSEKFSKLYAFAIEKFQPASDELLENTKGQWIKYPQGSDHLKLMKSLDGHGTGWCTSTSESSAKSQLDEGDFWVYYSQDQAGNPNIPRLAIRMKGNNKIDEVRGIAADQNLDQYINPVLDEKLKEFGPEGEKYHERTADMKHLTEIYKKTNQKQELTKEDLLFLYEINSIIEGFGYQCDPRIKEIKNTRNPKEDASVVLECEPNRIAHNPNEINDSTKAYIGPIFSGIFQKYPTLEYIYTSFPEGKIRFMETTIGGENKEELLKELKEKFKVSNYAEDMIKSNDFTTAKDPEKINSVRLKVKDLGIIGCSFTTDNIYAKAKEVGLDLCPAEFGPHLRSKYTNQPIYECIRIAMKQIAGRNDDPALFGVSHGGNGMSLDHCWGSGRRGEWGPDDEFIFRLRPSIKV